MMPLVNLFPQVSRDPSLADKVAAMMLETIVSQRMRPGDKLPSERELGEQFAVSRTVIREAVRSLAAKGLVEVRSGSGLRIAAVDGRAVRDSLAFFLRGNDALDYEKVHEVRSVLEVQMAASAAERASAEDIAALEKACREMEQAGDDVEAETRHDVEFHRALAHATQNELYIVLLDAIGDALVEVRRATLQLGSLEDALTSHRAILACVVQRDPEGAREAMRAHLETVENYWQQARDEEQALSSIGTTSSTVS
jgi:GntR family transcriptional repressor for pyruvate dehydrogenase complex